MYLLILQNFQECNVFLRQVQEKILNKFTKKDIENIHRYCPTSPTAFLSVLQKERNEKNYIGGGIGGGVIGDLSKETIV